MIKLYVCGALLIATCSTALAQGNGPGLWGARAAGLGQIATVLEDDVWATAANVAALGSLSQPTVGFGAENRFLLPSLNTVMAAAAVPLGRRNEAAAPVAGVAAAVAAAEAPRYGVVGITAQRFGGRLYSEQRLGLGYGYRLGTVRVGARVEVLQTSLEGLGSRLTRRTGRYYPAQTRFRRYALQPQPS